MACYNWLHAALLGWFDRSVRSMPWRGVSDPYAILVAEFMLQQTQVERVVPVYLAFLSHFPTLQSLARAPRRSGHPGVGWTGVQPPGGEFAGVRRRRLWPDSAGVFPKTSSRSAVFQASAPTRPRRWPASPTTLRSR